MRIVIVGAGVAGGIIARGLAGMPGIDLTLVEQVSQSDHAGAGNGLNVGPNAMRAAAAILPDLSRDLLAASLPWRRWRANLHTGEPIYEIPLDRVADRPGIRIRWSELYRIVRESAAGAIRYQRRGAGVRTGSGGRPTLELDGGDSISGVDLLIAADGRYSRIREQLCGPAAIRHLGVANFRLLVDDSGTTGIDDMEQWFHGPHRLLVFRLADGRLYVSGNLPIDPGGELDPRWKTPDGLRTAYLPARGPVDPRLVYLIGAAAGETETLHWSRAQEIDTRFHDAGGRVLFVGDSAHAMAPTLGQGATQAIEDACAFVDLFRHRAAQGSVDVPALTAAYDALRRERVEFVRRFSWDASTPLLHGQDPVRSHRDKLGPAYEAGLRRIYLEGPA